MGDCLNKLTERIAMNLWEENPDFSDDDNFRNSKRGIRLYYDPTNTLSEEELEQKVAKDSGDPVRISYVIDSVCNNQGNRHTYNSMAS